MLCFGIRLPFLARSLRAEDHIDLLGSERHGSHIPFGTTWRKRFSALTAMEVLLQVHCAGFVAANINWFQNAPRPQDHDIEKSHHERFGQEGHFLAGHPFWDTEGSGGAFQLGPNASQLIQLSFLRCPKTHRS